MKLQHFMVEQQTITNPNESDLECKSQPPASSQNDVFRLQNVRRLGGPSLGSRESNQRSKKAVNIGWLFFWPWKSSTQSCMYSIVFHVLTYCMYSAEISNTELLLGSLPKYSCKQNRLPYMSRKRSPFWITNMGHLSGLAGHSGQHRSDKVSIILSLWPYDITILWWLPPMEVPIGTPKPRLVWKSFNSDAKISILCHFLMTTPFSRIKLSSPALFRSIP